MIVEWLQVVQQLASRTAIGWVYALVALGFVLIYQVHRAHQLPTVPRGTGPRPWTTGRARASGPGNPPSPGARQRRDGKVA